MDEQKTTSQPQQQPAQTAEAPQAQGAPSGPPTRGFGGRGGNRPGQNRPRRRQPEPIIDEFGDELVEKVVFINRSSKVVKGGRRFGFSALVVVGNKKGRLGVGLGKATEVADAIRKGGESARSQMVSVNLRDTTIPHEVLSRYRGAKVLLRPASPGTGVIAGKTVRAVLESAGVRNVLSKSLGSKNAANVVKATLNALLSLRQREEILRNRGIESKPAEARPVEASAA
jgi:small subunit ribosomal protein S5